MIVAALRSHDAVFCGIWQPIRRHRSCIPQESFTDLLASTVIEGFAVCRAGHDAARQILRLRPPGLAQDDALGENAEGNGPTPFEKMAKRGGTKTL